MRAFSLDDLCRLRIEREDSGAGFYDETLGEASQRVQSSAELGKYDLGALVLWKRLQVNTKWARRLNLMADSDVRTITRTALATYRACRSDGNTVAAAADAARRALAALPGCGHGSAFPSVILATVDLDNLAVYDRWAVAALSAHPRFLVLLGRDDFGRYGRYIDAITLLRAELARHSNRPWTGREVDLALYDFGRAVGSG